ncbi:putative leucine-rich repeat domain, L domain-containing protein [Medicago truncatula]|nr:putative leucine-rich repeat domain, L domain-containing protein [Medicago truncatula]
MSSLESLDISNNRFTSPLPNNMPKGLKDFNASGNDISGVVPEILRKIPSSSFFPGNAKLHFPNSHMDQSFHLPKVPRGSLCPQLLK